MGHSLKIKHSYAFSGGDKDVGFNSFDQLTDPDIPAGMISTEFLGVVGGFNGDSTYPVVEPNANLYGTEDAAIIVAQKGATKYLVALETAASVTTIVPGRSYMISDLGTGDTNWAAIGASVNAVPGDVFTATTVGSGSGDILPCGICSLVNVDAGSLTAGQMQITVTIGGTTFNASRLTNKYVWDYSTPAVRYAANFFVTSGGDVITVLEVKNTEGLILCSPTTLTVGMTVTVSGTNTGTGSIVGYSSPSTYYIVDTGGTDDFTISDTPGGAPSATTLGTLTGLTFAVNLAETLKSGAEADTWANGTGVLELGEVANAT